MAGNHIVGRNKVGFIISGFVFFPVIDMEYWMVETSREILHDGSIVECIFLTCFREYFLGRLPADKSETSVGDSGFGIVGA